MYEIYILKSKIVNKYYVGHTANIVERLRVHNVGKVRATKAFRPWEVIYTEIFSDKSNAFRREMQIKSYKGGEAFRKILERCPSG